MTSPARSSPESPCKGICRIDPEHNLCVGCWRSIDEIAVWLSLDDDERRKILATCEAREARFARGDCVES